MRGKAIEQIARRRLFAPPFLAGLWWRIRRVGLIACFKQSHKLRFPVFSLQWVQARAALVASLLDGGFDVQQQADHLSCPGLVLLFGEKGQLTQVMHVTERMLAQIVPVRLPAVMHTDSLEVLEDADGIQGLLAAFGMDLIVRQLLGRTACWLPGPSVCKIPRFLRTKCPA